MSDFPHGLMEIEASKNFGDAMIPFSRECGDFGDELSDPYAELLRPSNALPQKT